MPREKHKEHGEGLDGQAGDGHAGGEDHGQHGGGVGRQACEQVMDEEEEPHEERQDGEGRNAGQLGGDEMGHPGDEAHPVETIGQGHQGGEPHQDVPGALAEVGADLPGRGAGGGAVETGWGPAPRTPGRRPG